MHQHISGNKTCKRRFKKNILTVLLLASLQANAALTVEGDSSNNLFSSPGSNIEISGNSVLAGTTSGGGMLTLDKGAQLSINGVLSVASGNNSQGIINLDGENTLMTVTDHVNEPNIHLASGNNAYGELNVLNGASLVVNGNGDSYRHNKIFLSEGIGSESQVKISGRGSYLSAEYLGGMQSLPPYDRHKSKYIINVSDQAELSVNILRVEKMSEDSFAATYVDNAKLKVKDLFINGGEVVLTNSANLSADGNIYFDPLIGYGAGLLDVSGEGTKVNANILYNFSGVVSVTNGAVMNLNKLYNGDTGQIKVSGSGATINIEGVSILSNNSLTLKNDGLFTISDHPLRLYGSAVVNIGSSQGESVAAPGYLSSTKGLNFESPGALLNFNHNADNYQFSTVVTGAGQVEQNAGTTTLSGDNSWSGATRVNGGTLKAGAERSFSSQSDYDINQGGTLDLNGYNQQLNSVSNAGKISLAGDKPGTVMTITGNYTGDNGLLNFSGVLAGDDSVTDKLHIMGDSAGTTRVTVKNMGGSGQQTLNGIELISVVGQSAGEFTQQGRIVAGAWEYHLQRGEGEKANNWYLSSQGNGGGEPSPPDENNPDQDPPAEHHPGGDNSGNNPGGNEGDNNGGDGDDIDHGNISGGGTDILRPEGGAYLANISAMEMLFSTPFSERPMTEECMQTVCKSSLWLKNSAGRTHSKDSSGQLHSRSDRYTIKLGGDLGSGGTASGGIWRVGALAGYGASHGSSESSISGWRARNELSGYTTGLYGSWFSGGDENRGAYLDGILQYSWINNSVQGEGLSAEHYRSAEMRAELETGYVFAVAPRHDESSGGLFVQPKAGIAWSGVDAGQHREANGTEMSMTGKNNVTTRLGVKAFWQGQTKDNSRPVTPYAEVSWLHDTQPRGILLDGVKVSQAGARNRADMHVGIEGQVTPQLSVSGAVGEQLGSHGYSDTSAALNLKYSF